MNETEKSGDLTTMVLWVGCLGILLIGIVALFYFRSFDTQYAAGYSERAFKSIKISDTEQNVLSLLGNPFGFQDTEPFVEWIYSADAQPNFEKTRACTGTYTSVRFDRTGHVQRISGQRQISARSVVFNGDGENYLKLTNEQIRKLKSKTQNEIRQKLGSPVAIYEYKATKVLRYSRSPSSSNYHLRSVGLDKDGRVVQIWREIYWD